MTDYERIGDYQPAEEGTFGLALTFLLVGLGVGALVALVIAPKSGRQMRRSLRRRYEDARDTIGDSGQPGQRDVRSGSRVGKCGKRCGEGESHPSRQGNSQGLTGEPADILPLEASIR